MSAYETELEAYANEAEGEAEQESFFNHLAAAADRRGRPQSLRRVALAAAKEAFRGASRLYPSVEGEGEFESEFESEFEQENEFEHEALLSPVRPGAALAMMEHMAHEAAAAESESEAAEQFLPLIPLAAKALMPLAMKALPVIGKMAAKAGGKLLAKAAPKLMKMAPQLLKKVTPNLTRGISQLTRGLFRNRSTRPLLRAVPTIARRTVGNLTKQIAAGRRVTPVTAARTLAKQTQRALGSPRGLKKIYTRGRRADARYHQRAGRFTGGRAPSVRSGGGAGPAAGANGSYAGAGAARPAFTAAGAPGHAHGGGGGGGGCQCFRAVPCSACGR
jgi:hypothetical protein